MERPAENALQLLIEATVTRSREKRAIIREKLGSKEFLSELQSQLKRVKGEARRIAYEGLFSLMFR